MEIENKGTQTIHKFDNGYGASVVSNAMSYGGDSGLYELAVIKFTGNDWNINYDTCITNDVVGHLTEDKVQRILTQIQALDDVASTWDDKAKEIWY
jgi:hypothetical protein